MTDLGPNTPSEPVEGFGTPFRPQSGDADLDAAVSRFVALSDTAGNPGAPTQARSWVTTVWDALARDIDLGPPSVPELVHRIDDPMCGPAEVAWALRLLAIDGAVAEAEPDGRWHLLVRPDPTPGPGVAAIAAIARQGEPLAHALNHLAAKLDAIHTRLDGIDRVTRQDAARVIAEVLTEWFDPPADHEDVDSLAGHIAEALYGNTTEGAAQ